MSERLAIHLLGTPAVEWDGERRPAPRGRKAWGLLCYLLSTESPPRRERLAELLFHEADDPLNALSWSISQLRRLLGPKASVAGETVELHLPPGAFVDIHALAQGTWLQALRIPELGHELLEGMTFSSSPTFEVWLMTERRRLAGATEDVLREAARASLAAGDSARAAALAARLVAANGLDEDAQELLVRAYALAGDHKAAERQRDACVALFRRELGTDPGPAVLFAAEARPHPGRQPERNVSPVSVRARLDAGLAAIDAGALDAGIASLRAAVADAYTIGDPELQERCLIALGSALVHGVRGRDGEGAGLLHEAIPIAERLGDDSAAAHAHRDLGYVEILRGRYERAQRWLGHAARLAATEPAERAWVHAVLGVGLADVGRHSDAIAELNRGLALAEEADLGQVQVWALTFIGRSHLLRGELEAARQHLERALELVRRLRWTAFLPVSEVLLADVDLAEGQTDRAAAGYEHGYELSLQLEDPCWEGLAARGIGLVAERRGDPESAIRWVAQARTRCVRLPDAWLWVEGYCLDALCRLAIDHRRPEATRWIADLDALASRTGMRELVARAYLHRARLGDGAAAAAARVLAAEVDNPTLLADG